MPATPQLLDLAALGTIGGMTLATTAVTNGLWRSLGWQPRWLGLMVSLVICLATAFFAGNIAGADLFLAVLNAFIVYLAAAGTSGAGAAIQGGDVPTPANEGRELPGMEEEPSERQFLRSWF